MTPVCIETGANKKVRFYQSPLEGADFPWVSFSDVASMIFPSSEHRIILEDRYGAEYPDLTRRVVDGSMILPDFSTKGMFQWAGKVGLEQAWAIARLYEEAAAGVLASLYSKNPWSIMTEFIREASLRNMPVERVAYAN